MKNNYDQSDVIKMYYLKSLPSLLLKDEVDLNAYVKRRKIIEDNYLQTKSWNSVIISAVFYDEPTTQEAFIDVIEEIYNTRVIDPKQLKELIGIQVDWTEETLISFLQLCIYTNRETKFSDVIENAFRYGAKYQDVLKYDIKEYGLPETWINWWGIEINKDDLVKLAIYYAFDLGYGFPHADITKVKEKIEAPFDLLYEIVNYYGSYMDSKVRTYRFTELKLKGYSLNDSLKFEEQVEKGKWN
jgi:hypothetical protein